MSRTFEGKIRSNSLFRDCCDATLKTVLECPQKEYELGEQVSHEDASKLGIVLSGHMTVRSIQGGKVLMNSLEPGQVFGAAVVFSGGNDITEITADAKSKVVFIERNVLEEIFRNDTEVAVKYAEFLSGKIVFLNKKIMAFTSPRADMSLATYILSQAEESDEIKFNASYAADRLGIGRTTLYRALEALTGDGLIELGGGRLKILDREGLRKRN